MKLQPEKSAVQTISGYGPGWISVDGQRIEHSVVISWSGQQTAWHCRTFADVGAAHFEQLAELEADLIVFGSGDRLRFPPAAWLAPLMARRIGLETMDTKAACRTYNILAGEGRKVAAALLIEFALP
jgi:uncharacterized protein